MPRATPDRRRTKLTVQAEVTEGEPGLHVPPADARPTLVIEAPDGSPLTLRFDVPPRP
jgi:hypothetical protein